jgi:chromosome segregation ATPase
MSLTDGKPIPPPSTNPPAPGLFSTWLGRIVVIGFILLSGGLIYLGLALQKNQKALLDSQDQLATLKKDLATAANKTEKALEVMRDDFGVVREKLGVTQTQLDQARESASRIRAEQESQVKQLNAKLSQKADTQQVNAIQQEASSKIGAVSADVSQVRTDVDATKKELEGTRRDLSDVKDTLTQAIARNHDELQQLRLKGERNFYEFTVEKKKGPMLVGDLRIVLNKADQKKKKFDLKVIVDDNTLEKKDRTVNEPVQFLVGRTKLRYEIVVNDVQKDKIVGYLSTPKDKGLSAER